MRRRAFVGFAALSGIGALAAPLARAAAARVVVVGGGFAGSACALALKRLDPRLDVSLVDPDERYVTCPMSNEVLTGQRTLASLTLTRAGLRRAGVRFARARAVALDPARRSVRLDGGTQLPYDRCVVAPGIRFLWGKPEGCDEAAMERMPHAWIAGAQTTRLAALVHGMPDGGVLAICVPAGLMRCPPGPYARASLLAAYLRRHKPRSKLLIFDANNHFPRQDAFTAAWDELYRGRIEWIPPTQGGVLERVDAATNTLYTSSGAHRVAVANLIPPQAPGTFAVENGLATGHGWCPVDATSFESESIARVHVIGDACIAGAMPKAASAAVSQARQCAAAIVAALGGREAPQPQLDSVCFSEVSDERALAIRANFRVNAGRIEAGPPASGPGSLAATAGERLEARRWYADVRAAAFGEHSEVIGG